MNFAYTYKYDVAPYGFVPVQQRLRLLTRVIPFPELLTKVPTLAVLVLLSKVPIMTAIVGQKRLPGLFH